MRCSDALDFGAEVYMKENLYIGLDIGTTTISAVVLDGTAGTVRQVCNIPNDSEIPSSYAWEHRQNPVLIREKIMTMLNRLLTEYETVSAIGITGQMHGILYVSPAGGALSPLYTWQDGRAGLGEPSVCDEIRAKTGYRTAGGYGLATHCALMQSGDVPAKAYLCTIMDYIGIGLCGLTRPVIHATNAASLGLYRITDTGEDGFDKTALRLLGIDPDILPVVTDQCRITGTYRHIPVAVGIGDNQAAFLGSVRDPERSVLVNIGTGSQVSLLCGRDAGRMEGAVETRPYDGETRLLSGSGLCGGRAYAMLEAFFRRYAVSLGLPDEKQYDTMNTLAERGLAEGKILSVETTFCGTREDPARRGQITGIGENDLTPEGLTAGVLHGMAQELYGMYKAMPHGSRDILVASGNGVRRNPALRRILQQTFGMALYVPCHTEEAAFGAALFAAGAAGAENLQKCIRYGEE